MTEDRTECNETGRIRVSLSRICSLIYMVDKALAEVQKGVQLSSLCLPSSTPLNINAALIPPVLVATLIVYRFFFNRGSDL